MLETDVPDVISLQNMLRRDRSPPDSAEHSRRRATEVHNKTGQKMQQDSVDTDQKTRFDAALFQIAIRRAEPGTIVLPARDSRHEAVVTLAGDAMVSAHYRLGNSLSLWRRHSS